VLNDTHLQHFETSTEDTFVCHKPYHSALEYATKMHQLAGMLSPRPGLGLKAQKTGLGLMITGLGLVITGLGLLTVVASWPRSF